LRASQAAEPLQNQPQPVEPMQSVSMDLYEVRGRHFLVMVDRYLYFCWTAQLQSQTSSTVIKIIDNWFCGVGYPQYVFSDSGPQFAAAEFKEYCKKHHITPLVSSACYPMSNGLAESSVKTIKYLLLKSDNYIDFEKQLYEMQNIPSSGDIMSPAEKFYKRRLRTDLPTLDPFFNPVQIEEKGRKRLKIGDKERIQNAVSKRWDDFGVVCDIRDSGRSYYIDRSRGRDVILRNNIFLKLMAPPPIADRAGEESSDSLAMQPEASLQAENSSMHAVRRSKQIENKNLPTGLPKHVHVPAVPIRIENKYLAVRRSNRTTKLPVRFAT
jgi:hypothetical protein